MQVCHSTRPDESRLRIVFKDDAVFFSVSTNSTLADVAHWVERVAERKHRAPVGVSLTLTGARSPLNVSAPRMDLHGRSRVH
jgi:hypothetical protein